MKRIIKTLIPTSIVVSMGTICLTGCSTATNVAIPVDKLNIIINGDKVSLDGLKNPKEDLSNYDTLCVPKNVQDVYGFKYDLSQKANMKGYECIKVVKFEEGSECTSIGGVGFQDLPNLTKIIFAPKISSLTYFGICDNKKLSELDISKVLDVSFLENNRGFGEVQKNGKLIINANQVEDAKKILEANTDLNGWTYEIR